MGWSGSVVSALVWHSGGWVWGSTSGTRRKYFPVGLDAASLPHTVPKAAPQTLTGCSLPVSFFRTHVFPNVSRMAPRRGEWGELMIFGALMAQRWLGLAIYLRDTP